MKKIKNVVSNISENSIVDSKVSPELWNNLTRDVMLLQSTGTTIAAKYIQENYNVSKNDADRLVFALNNIDIIHNEVNKDLSDRKYKSQIKEVETKNKQLLHELDISERRVDFLLNTQSKSNKNKVNNNYSNDTTATISKASSKQKQSTEREACAFGILSDVHIEERVDDEVVNGMNEYNLDIAKQRVEKFFVNLLKLVNKERQDIKINKLVLGLLGDFITGYIHEDLKENNYLSPTEATLYVEQILVDGIKYLVEKGEFNEIVIPCTKGNHGRTTSKKRFSTAYKNSYEWMMYKHIENTFKLLSETDKKYKIIKFVIPKSELTYIKVYDKMIRFGHGDHFSFGGGVGGVIIPMSKWLYRMNEQTPADMTFLGHWHNILLEPTPNCMLNGSVIGMTPYGVSFGGANRPPQQIFTILDTERGFSVRTHIDLD